ncbi:MAG TPA: rod shape-determining protein RodA [Bryobacteraceae bacterium]|nr:rod shape-determining protein RodA [Bryobacteraceae bacterium]
MARQFTFRDIDWVLVSIVLIICGVGVVQIFSATIDTDFHSAWWRQILYVACGLLLMYMAMSVDYHSLTHYVPWLYIAAVAALGGTALLGNTVFGSKRWIQIPGIGMRLQVSEFVKLVIILLVARYLTDLKRDELEIREMLILSGLVVVPVGLVLMQPDMGTALTYLAVLVAGAFVAGLRWKYVAAIAVMAVFVVPVGWHLLKDYQKARLVSFMDPERDPQGTGYQLIQSQIAVGAGGMFGKGVTKGTQTQLRFLPVPHTDFIFSAFAEEWGFVGVAAVLSLYFVMIMRIVQNAQTAPDRAGMYICMGVAGLLLFTVLVNVGMVVGRMPVTGIPLPFMSAGGSSIWSNFLALGLVNNVRLRTFIN